MANRPPRSETWPWIRSWNRRAHALFGLPVMNCWRPEVTAERGRLRRRIGAGGRSWVSVAASTALIYAPHFDFGCGAYFHHPRVGRRPETTRVTRRRSTAGHPTGTASAYSQKTSRYYAFTA